METKLIKVNDDYSIKQNGEYVAFANEDFTGYAPQEFRDNLIGVLSKQNCDGIFGVIDVEKLADELKVGISYKEYDHLIKRGIIVGFNKAMELNKDKLFTLEDLKKAIEFDQYEFAYGEIECRKNENQINEFIQSFQHPTQIEVEITCMKDCQSNPQCDEFENNCIHCTNTGIPLLNSDGNLILKKI